jgi:uroporphyrinogen decarboxylase
MMTARERVLTALAHKETDRVPFALGMGFNPPVVAEISKFKGHKSISETQNYLEAFSDIIWVRPAYIGPKHRGFTDINGVQTDHFGVQRAPVHYAACDGAFYNEICAYPLGNIETMDELHAYEFPKPEWFDYRSLFLRIKKANRQGEKAIMLPNGNIFESAWYMRGFETMLMDFYENPELAYALMEKITDFFIGFFTAALETAKGKIDIVFTADDIGGQEGLLMSLPMWERMIKPHHRRMNAVLHNYGVKVLYHTDGAVMDAVPGLIDMGIDVLEALQFDAKGMCPETLKNTYGDRLSFHGGISVQHTLPYGTPDDVSREIERLVRVLGKDGGYILAPSHAVQAGTPMENVHILLEYLEGLQRQA